MSGSPTHPILIEEEDILPPAILRDQPAKTIDQWIDKFRFYFRNKMLVYVSPRVVLPEGFYLLEIDQKNIEKWGQKQNAQNPTSYRYLQQALWTLGTGKFEPDDLKFFPWKGVPSLSLNIKKELVQKFKILTEDFLAIWKQRVKKKYDAATFREYLQGSLWKATYTTKEFKKNPTKAEIKSDDDRNYEGLDELTTKFAPSELEEKFEVHEGFSVYGDGEPQIWYHEKKTYSLDSTDLKAFLNCEVSRQTCSFHWGTTLFLMEQSRVMLVAPPVPLVPEQKYEEKYNEPQVQRPTIGGKAPRRVIGVKRPRNLVQTGTGPLVPPRQWAQIQGIARREYEEKEGKKPQRPKKTTELSSQSPQQIPVSPPNPKTPIYRSPELLPQSPEQKRIQKPIYLSPRNPRTPPSGASFASSPINLSPFFSMPGEEKLVGQQRSLLPGLQQRPQQSGANIPSSSILQNFPLGPPSPTNISNFPFGPPSPTNIPNFPLGPPSNIPNFPPGPPSPPRFPFPGPSPLSQLPSPILQFNMGEIKTPPNTLPNDISTPFKDWINQLAVKKGGIPKTKTKRYKEDVTRQNPILDKFRFTPNRRRIEYLLNVLNNASQIDEKKLSAAEKKLTADLENLILTGESNSRMIPLLPNQRLDAISANLRSKDKQGKPDKDAQREGLKTLHEIQGYTDDDLAYSLKANEPPPPLQFVTIQLPGDKKKLDEISQWLLKNNQYTQYCSRLIDTYAFQGMCASERNAYNPAPKQMPKGKNVSIEERETAQESISEDYWNELMKGEIYGDENKKQKYAPLKDREAVLIMGFLVEEGKTPEQKTTKTLQNFLIAIPRPNEIVELVLFCNDPAGAYDAYEKGNKKRPSIQLYDHFEEEIHRLYPNTKLLILKALVNSERFWFQREYRPYNPQGTVPNQNAPKTNDWNVSCNSPLRVRNVTSIGVEIPMYKYLERSTGSSRK